jgi:hypothetical protein
MNTFKHNNKPKVMNCEIAGRLSQRSVDHDGQCNIGLCARFSFKTGQDRRQAAMLLAR